MVKRDLQDAIESAASTPAAAGATRGLLLRVPVEMHRELRLLALDEDTSLQALGIGALQQVLAGRGRGSAGSG